MISFLLSKEKLERRESKEKQGKIGLKYGTEIEKNKEERERETSRIATAIKKQKSPANAVSVPLILLRGRGSERWVFGDAHGHRPCLWLTNTAHSETRALSPRTP